MGKGTELAMAGLATINSGGIKGDSLNYCYTGDYTIRVSSSLSMSGDKFPRHARNLTSSSVHNLSHQWTALFLKYSNVT